MSERNGDKSRFGRERRAKILRRKQTRLLRNAPETKNAPASPQYRDLAFALGTHHAINTLA